MVICLSQIKKYILENNIENNLDHKTPIECIPSLGILQIIKENNNQHWIIKMIILKDCIYKNGVFTITIDFPQNFPNCRPEVRICNKIYHLQVNPKNGHIYSEFLHDWKNDTSIVELLVGIYLVFIFPPDHLNFYDVNMCTEFLHKRSIFDKNAKEWVLYHAPINENDIFSNYKEIKKLRDELTLIKLENNKLKNIENVYNLLKNETEKFQSLNEKLENKIKNNLLINNNINIVSVNKMNELLEELKLKENELKEFKSNFPFDLKKGEKLMTVIFQSVDQKVHYAFICKNTDKFNIIENLLYDKYPEYIDSENYFTVNGIKINKYKTFEQNNIKFSDIIIMQQINL